MENSIEITENAQKHIAKIVKDDNATYFRITVLGGGCAGFQYKFDIDKIKNQDDIEIKTEKIALVIDDTSLNLIKGSKIDFVGLYSIYNVLCITWVVQDLKCRVMAY